ncbi:MAG TPA: hypothetical protein VLA60_08595 [Nitrospirales bacterium]|nr:hypothetical protein [Nitrospirales bacterium]
MLRNAGSSQNCSSSPALSHAERKASAAWTSGAYEEYVSKARQRPACAKPLRRRQGTPLAAFFTIPITEKP